MFRASGLILARGKAKFYPHPQWHTEVRSLGFFRQKFERRKEFSRFRVSEFRSKATISFKL
ncbi:hypothetical protein LEP1GSC047_1265 [Leptospira inadai serovar Lyme str. 10]|uniref:Uncharacterized protein n=1 Tax=Leptospira inadai serovar Lyme str. 10 TaxID=1049790 RepID=V6H7W9_9LEPT|nr:hypothetical protein LEP1GSC047_1265 [Leptospira inadai serovar Lyme str. 10]